MSNDLKCVLARCQVVEVNDMLDHIMAVEIRLDELDRLSERDGLRSWMVKERIDVGAKLLVLRHQKEEVIRGARV